MYCYMDRQATRSRGRRDLVVILETAICLIAFSKTVSCFWVMFVGHARAGARRTLRHHADPSGVPSEMVETGNQGKGCGVISRL